MTVKEMLKYSVEGSVGESVEVSVGAQMLEYTYDC